MRLFDAAEIDAALNYPGLIDILDEAFRGEVVAPKRGQYAIERPGEDDAILLTMPAWSGPAAEKPYIGTKIVSVFFDEIVSRLTEDGRVELRGFGAFSTRARDGRTGRNPRTGETVDVAPKRVPYFKPGKEMRVRLNV